MLILSSMILSAASLLSSCTHRTLLTDMQASHGRLRTGRLLVDDLPKIPLYASTKVWFVRPNKGAMEVVAVKRRIGARGKVEDAVRALLEGPSAAEIAAGLGSEIPRGTVLLGVNQKSGVIELNLSHRFASGGGTDSIETRLEQLAKTVMSVAEQQEVFLNVEGHRLTMTPGEGIEVRQPINK